MQFKTLEYADRKQIAALYAESVAPKEIAQQIGVTPNTIYAELKRGQTTDGQGEIVLDQNFRPAYDPDLAEKRRQEALRRRGRTRNDNTEGGN